MPRRPAADVRRPHLVRVADRFPTLAGAGVALERFPRYVNDQLRPHRVDVVLISCVIAGEAIHQLDGQTQSFRAGDVGITLYDHEHDLLTVSPTLDVVNVYLDLMRHPLPVLPAPWDRILARLLPPHRGLVAPLCRHLHLRVPDAAALTHLLERMLDEQQQWGHKQGHLLAHLLALLLVDLCRAAQLADRRLRNFPASPARQPPWLDKVQELIDRHHHRPIGLPDMVQLAHVSTEHLCRRFKHHTGLPPLTYLTHRRIQHAAWLLRTSALPVTAIAHRCGFDHLSHFHRKFKQVIGQAPTAYSRRGLSRNPPRTSTST